MPMPQAQAIRPGYLKLKQGIEGTVMAQYHHSRTWAFVFGMLLCWTLPAYAQAVMGLQVTASPSHTEPTELSLETLDAMDQVTFTTTTIWTDGDVEFSGVPLKALLDHVEADGSTVEMVALNDYAVSMPIDALEDTAPIVATRMNGETMSVRDKGPYWVVFPYDSDPKYRTEPIYALSIWQLNRLKVVD